MVNGCGLKIKIDPGSNGYIYKTGTKLAVSGNIPVSISLSLMLIFQ